MRSRALIAVLALALPLALARHDTAPPRPQRAPGAEPLSPALPWRARGSSGAAVAALLQLLREEDADSPALVPPQKRDMHDFFVGLMGKRAAEPGGRGSRGGATGTGTTARGPSARCSPGLPPDGSAAAGPLRRAP